jgi:hypothetical protein
VREGVKVQVLVCEGGVWFKAVDVLQTLREEDTLREAREDLAELFLTVACPVRAGGLLTGKRERLE